MPACGTTRIRTKTGSITMPRSARADVLPQVQGAVRVSNTGNPGLQQYLPPRRGDAQVWLYDGLQLDNVSTEFPFFEKLVGKWISAVPVKLTVRAMDGQRDGHAQDNHEGHRPMQVSREKTIIFNHMRSGEPADPARMSKSGWSKLRVVDVASHRTGGAMGLES